MKIFHNGYLIASSKGIKKKWATGLLIALGWLGLVLFVVLSSNKTTYAVQERVVDTLSIKVDELKSDMLDTLQACERSKYTEDDGIIIFDSNNKASIGTFQFQKATVIHYYKTLYGKDITGKEAVLIALDDNKARELAHDIIFSSKNGLSNWYNCTQKHGLEGQLAVINKLIK
jgi:hypothetical protein